MAEIFLTLNGVGRGHLTRTLELCRWLRRSKRRPVIFLQGCYPAELAMRYPGASIPALYTLEKDRAQSVADEIARYALLSTDSVIFEDTHPAPVSWPISLQRVLIVRPTTINHMRLLRYRYSQEFRTFVVCDHPSSPSWPYSEAETSEMQGWPNWKFVGPIFRRATIQGVSIIRGKYKLTSDQEIFVFTLGGGGERPGSGDRISFIQNAETIALDLRKRFRKARMIFVCGPLFDLSTKVPSIFEVIAEEPELPCLFAVARGAIIRPGFNSTWECIASATPFVAIPGQTYLEPSAERLVRLNEYGLQTAEAIDYWCDDEWRRKYRRTCRSILKTFTGEPVAQFMQSVFPASDRTIVKPRTPRRYRGPDIDASCLDRLRDVLKRNIDRKSLLLRLDDVITLSAPVRWFISACKERSLFASLEIIPYFSSISRAEIERFDERELFEVSAHGYAHVPYSAKAGQGKGEFSQEGSPSTGDIRTVQKIVRIMRKYYGSRFKGGYSAPYDGLPKWLPDAWIRAGGRYISWIWSKPTKTIRNVRMCVDPWNWIQKSAFPLTKIAAEVLLATQEYQETGIVLHPQNLYERSNRNSIMRLIDTLIESGFQSCQISRAAEEVRSIPNGGKN